MTSFKTSTSFTSVFMKLHWLPVQYRPQFKILLQMCKTAYGFSPVKRNRAEFD